MRKIALKNGHIIQHRAGFRYKLVGEVENAERGASAKYSVIERGRIVPMFDDGSKVCGPGFFPYADYRAVRLGKPVSV